MIVSKTTMVKALLAMSGVILITILIGDNMPDYAPQ